MEVARSAGGIVLNNGKIFQNAEHFEPSLQQPLSHGLAVTGRKVKQVQHYRSSKTSAGDFQPRHFLGRLLIRLTI